MKKTFISIMAVGCVCLLIGFIGGMKLSSKKDNTDKTTVSRSGDKTIDKAQDYLIKLSKDISEDEVKTFTGNFNNQGEVSYDAYGAYVLTEKDVEVLKALHYDGIGPQVGSILVKGAQPVEITDDNNSGRYTIVSALRGINIYDVVDAEGNLNGMGGGWIIDEKAGIIVQSNNLYRTMYLCTDNNSKEYVPQEHPFTISYYTAQDKGYIDNKAKYEVK